MKPTIGRKCHRKFDGRDSTVFIRHLKILLIMHSVTMAKFAELTYLAYSACHNFAGMKG